MEWKGWIIPQIETVTSSIKKKGERERGKFKKTLFFFTSEPSLLIITLDEIYGGSDPLRPMIMSTTRVE